MLRPNSSRLDPKRDGLPPPPEEESSYSGVSQVNATQTGGIDIQGELERLKELIVSSFRIPLTRYTLVDEDQLLDQIELVQFNLPPAFEQAAKVVEHREDIILDAKEYAQELVLAAEQQAAEILDEMELVQQARMEAQRIRQQCNTECQMAQEQTIAEIDRVEQLAQQELEEMRRKALQECEAIQKGADEYAERVLVDIEQRLTDMLRVIRNGREQLRGDLP